MGSDAFAVAPLLQIIQKFLSCPEKSSPVILAVKAKIKKASYFLAINKAHFTCAQTYFER